MVEHFATNHCSPLSSTGGGGPEFLHREREGGVKLLLDVLV